MKHLPPHILYTADIGALIGVVSANFGLFSGAVGILVGILAAVNYSLQIWDRFRK